MYQVIFSSGNYSRVDYETESYYDAINVKDDLVLIAREAGEREFFYSIVEKD